MSDSARILLAEDSEDIRVMVRVLLEERGFEVLDAPDGELAVDLARAAAPDVAVLDIEMPRLDGYGVLEAFQRDPQLSLIPCVFITGRDSADGVADALDRGGHDFIRKPFESAELIARVRSAVRVRRLQDALRALNVEFERQACQDALTTLYNRRFLDGHLERAIARARRHGRRLALLIVDVDRFKSINDTFGHHAGDTVLREIARRLLRRVRAEDLLGRWGGEEFMLIAGDTDGPDADALAVSLCEAVASEPFLIEGEELVVTVSVGWANWTGGQETELVQRADRALYQAKEAGRNRVAGAAD